MAQTSISEESVQRKHALFKKYVEPYQRMIFKLVIQYTNSRDNVEDNFVEVLANLYRYIETYDPSKSIHTWLHIVTKRCVYDLDKKRKRHSDMLNDDNDIDTFSDADLYDEGISERVMGVDNYQQLYADDVLWALQRLKPQYRRAILYQTAGYKLKEIAELEHNNGALESSNIDTVKSRLFLARQDLKKMLTRDGNRRTEASQKD